MDCIAGRTHDIRRFIEMSVTMEEAQPVEESSSKEKMLIFEDHEYLMKTLENLNKLRKSKQFCDAILQVGSTQDVHEIHAHRVVLASASPYLLDLFAKESQPSGHVAQIKLNGTFDLVSFKCLVNYAYTSRLEVPPEKLKSIYMTAKKLKMDAAAHQCGEHLIANLSPDNCIGIRAIPELSLDRSLLKKVDSFIKANIAEVVNGKELLALPQVQVELLQNTSEEMKATNSSHLCEMVLDWVKQSCQESFQMGFLTEKVHMLYLHKDDSLHDCNDIENGACQDSELIQDYKKLSRRLSTPMNLGKSSSNSASGTPSKPRNFLFTQEEVDEATANLVATTGEVVTEKKIWKIVATTFTGENSILGLSIMDGNMVVLSIVQRLNTPNSASTSPGESQNGSVERSDIYTLIPPMSSPRCAVGTGDFNGKLLVCGGYDRGECLKTVEVYDETENKWTTMKPMKVPRGRFDIAVLDGKVYAIGGCDGSKELNSAEYFDQASNKWIQLPNLPSVRSNAGVCQLDGKIYVIGGWNGQRGITRCDVFDPETATWTSIAPLSTGRYQAGAAAFDGAVYAIGGCDTWSCLNSVEKYDTATDTWTVVSPMNIPRRGCGVAFFKGQLYVVGGHDGVHSLCTTEIYDPETNAWRSGPSLTNCRANVGVTVVGNRLFAVGGFNGKAFLNSVEYLDINANAWNTSVMRVTGDDANHNGIPSSSSSSS